MPAVPFKLNQDRRHHIPRQQHKVTNWPAYEAGLRQRGSLTVWFSEEAIAAWAAEPRTTRGGQPWYSPLAILTALTLRTVFRLAYRQTEGLIGSIIALLGLTLRVPDHTTLSRRAATLAVSRPTTACGDGQPVYLLVDSTGLKLCGAGEWLVEKHGTQRRRAWRKLHLGVDAKTGQIVAAALTIKEVDDAAQVGALLDQLTGSLSAFIAVLSATAGTEPTQRDQHLHCIAETGRAGWQKASGYTTRAKVEATIGRWKQVIGDGLSSRRDDRRMTDVNVVVHVLNRMLEFGRPSYVRIA